MALRFLSNYQFLKQPSVVEEIDVCYIYRLPTRREMEAAMDETTTPSTQRQKEAKTDRINIEQLGIFSGAISFVFFRNNLGSARLLDDL